MEAPHTYISIVTYNSASYICACLHAIIQLEHYTPGSNLTIEVIDNASTDETCDLILGEFADLVTLVKNPINLGFSGGHNLAVTHFLNGNADYFLVLNPDVSLSPPALEKLVLGIEKFEKVGAVSPLLIRADEELRMLEPAVVDSAGIIMTPSLRHFDRGAESEAIEEFQREEFVFGGTGACLLLNREFIEDVSFRGEKYEEDLGLVYPELLDGMNERTQLFDEAFFAYREDADLAWRAQRLGWNCLFLPNAYGFHRRKVTPERRQELPPIINLLGVKNRFLLQLNNLSFLPYRNTWLPGVFLRNILVVIGVLLVERPSLKGLHQAWLLRRRARERCRLIRDRSRRQPRDVARWFGGKCDIKDV